MNSAATRPPDLETALRAAVARFDGSSPVTEQVHRELGLDRPGAGRLLPRTVLAAAAAEGGDPAAALGVACAVELLAAHVAVHEDIALRAAERDGRAALWSRDGLAHGINAGDTLCALAFLQLLDEPAWSPARTAAMTRRLHAADYEACGRWAAALVAGERALPVESRAVLAGVACALGASAAGADPVRTDAYDRLGRAAALGDRSGADSAAAAAGIDAGGGVRALLSPGAPAR